MNSQQKGKRKEREIAKLLSDKFSTSCKRTPCSGSLDFKGDIIAFKGIIGEYHWEIKNQEKLNIWKALKQSIRDCPVRKTPLLVFSKAFSENFVALRFDDFTNLLKEMEESKLKEIEK